MIARMPRLATAPTPGSVGIVETQFLDLREPLRLDCGRELSPMRIAYETYGTLSPARDNVILVCHALSGDHHCAGWHKPEDKKPGWWNNLIGPGKAVDTRRFYVVCANVLGGCQGSTGPSCNHRGSRPDPA